VGKDGLHRSLTKKINKKVLYELPLCAILYSNVKSKTTWYLNNNVSLLTETYLSTCSKYDCDFHYGEEISEIDAHELNDITRQIGYFSNEDVNSLEITIPDFLEFRLSDSYRQVLNGERSPDYLSNFEFEVPLTKYKQLPSDKKYIGEFYLSFVLSFLHEIHQATFINPYAILKGDDFKRINLSLNREVEGLEYFKSFLKDYSNRKYLKNLFEKISYYTNVEIDKIRIAFLNKIELITFLEKYTDENFVNIEDKNKLKKLVKLYSESIYKYQYLTLKWAGLSSGENAKLNFYARIYERIHNKLKTLGSGFIPNKNLIVLIDEGATFFHPEWQRSYIYDIIKYFEEVIIKSSIVEKVHIILTSHSPFVISDLTRDQVIYLKKEKRVDSSFNFCKVVSEENKPLSFAGNISSLYRHSFFLQDTLTGKFSHVTLDNIINKLVEKNKDLNLELVEYLLSEISEPILKNHISRLLEKYKQ